LPVAGGFFKGKSAGVRLPAGERHALTLPRQRVRDDGRKLAELRLLAEQGASAIRRRHDPGRIARPARRKIRVRTVQHRRRSRDRCCRWILARTIRCAIH